MAVKQREFYYQFLGYNCPTVCHVRVLAAPGRQPIALCTELLHNPGPSITNVAEALLWCLPPVVDQALGSLNVFSEQPVLFIEHYNHSRPGRPGRPFSATYDLVGLNENGRAAWRHLGASPAQAAQQLGYPSLLLVVSRSVVEVPVSIDEQNRVMVQCNNPLTAHPLYVASGMQNGLPRPG